MEQKIFLPGQPVIYLPTTPQGNVYKVEYGIVKRMSKDGKSAYVWYHSGCTAASTPIEYLVASLILPQHDPMCGNIADALLVNALLVNESKR